MASVCVFLLCAKSEMALIRRNYDGGIYNRALTMTIKNISASIKRSNHQAKVETVCQCSKEIENNSKRNHRKTCKLTKSDDEGEYSLALLPEGTAVPDLDGMTLT